MGQATGKFVIPHVSATNKPVSNDTTSPDTMQVETASQLVNGDASVLSNVPAIDDVVEPTTTVAETPTEEVQAVDNGNGPNGTVHPTEGGGDAPTVHKKKSNPITWIKRRLSKKSVNSKPSVTGEEETHPTTEEPVAVPSEEEIKETAHSLVDDVITEASTEQAQVTTAIETPAPEVHFGSIEDSKESTLKPPVSEEIPTEPSVEAEQPETQQQEPEVDDEAHIPVLDSNNTNAVNEADLDQPDAAAEPQETIMSKLNELELTNGHSGEGVLEHVNGIEGEHGDVAVNGE